MNFISFMMTLNRVFIQDAAAMLVLHPEKIDHPLFRLEVFRSVEFSVSSLFLFLLLLLLYLLRTNLLSYFKRFKTKMQAELDDENVSPLDTALESVVPGVHQHFVAMDGTLNTLDRKVVAGFDKLDKLDTKVDGLVDLFNDLQANNRERDAKLADSLWTLAERLGTPAVSTPPFSPQTRRQQQVQSPSRGGNNQPSLPSPVDAARGHQMVPKHHLIQSLWNEWYGLEDCQDKPVVGGIAAMERQQKSK
jgi:hypothetical protein